MTALHQRVAIDCFVRASASIELVDDAVSQLREHHEAGRIDELTVRAWPNRVRLGADPLVDSVLNHFHSFRDWADDHGVALDPAFRLREETTMIGEESHTVLLLPVLCLAVHVDGKLRTVVPHTSEKATYTVPDALEDIATVGASLEPSAAPFPVRETEVDVLAE